MEYEMDQEYNQILRVCSYKIQIIKPRRQINSSKNIHKCLILWEQHEKNVSNIAIWIKKLYQDAFARIKIVHFV